MSKATLGWAVLSTGLAVGFAGHDVSTRAERRQLEREKSVLTGQVGRLTARLRAVPRPAPVIQTSNASEPAPAKPDLGILRSLAERDQSISTLRQDIASARAKMGELENTLLTLQSQAAQQDQESKQLAAAQASADRRAAELQHSLELERNNLHEEKAKSDELESVNAILKTQIAAAAPASQTSELRAQLRDINRRRETQMREIANRYRDISSQYRSLTGALAGRQNEQTGPWNSAELSRIQNAISSQEDDLRRLDELNSQAALVEKKLAKH